ncbi:unnamed protein product [Amoebophrya sp. A120]|nr:unnamed protein product [Amoebophrya sp. A120]|eukprot:GSA120T00007104001.1
MLLAARLWFWLWFGGVEVFLFQVRSPSTSATASAAGSTTAAPVGVVAATTSRLAPNVPLVIESDGEVEYTRTTTSLYRSSTTGTSSKNVEQDRGRERTAPRLISSDEEDHVASRRSGSTQEELLTRTVPPSVHNSASSSPAHPELPLLTCSYNEEWNAFRKLLLNNEDDNDAEIINEHAGFGKFNEELYAHADYLVGKHFKAFMEFKQSKSNEFFFDCSRKEIVGKICYFGMLNAFAIQYRYLKMKVLLAEWTNQDWVVEQKEEDEGRREIIKSAEGRTTTATTLTQTAPPSAATATSTRGERQIMEEVRSFLQLLLMNKNNCLDFLDESGWPTIAIKSLFEEVRPEVESRQKFLVPGAEHDEKERTSADGHNFSQHDNFSHRRSKWQKVEELFPVQTAKTLASEFYYSQDLFYSNSDRVASYTFRQTRQERMREVVIYATGTHSSLAQEPMTMLSEYVSDNLNFGSSDASSSSSMGKNSGGGEDHHHGFLRPSMTSEVRIRPIYEIIDSTHCQFFSNTQECEQKSGRPQSSSSKTTSSHYIGFQEVSTKYFTSVWGNLLIENYLEFEREIQERFEAKYSSSSSTSGRTRTISGSAEIPRDEIIENNDNYPDIILCSSPAIMCNIFAKYLDKIPLLGYIGEPLLLAVEKSLHDFWFKQFERLVNRKSNTFFAVYNPFLKHMIRYQTGLDLPAIRVSGKYTGMQYGWKETQVGTTTAKKNQFDILVAKGPNICVDPICLLKKTADETRKVQHSSWKNDKASNNEEDGRYYGSTYTMKKMHTSTNSTSTHLAEDDDYDVLNGNPVAFAVTEEQETMVQQEFLTAAHQEEAGASSEVEVAGSITTTTSHDDGIKNVADEDEIKLSTAQPPTARIASETPPAARSTLSDTVKIMPRTTPEDVSSRGGLVSKKTFRFFGLDEFGPQHGSKRLSHSDMASRFYAVVMYPYDVSLMLFYELYSAAVPIFLPDREYLKFFVFRGLHAYRQHHVVYDSSSGVENENLNHNHVGDDMKKPGTSSSSSSNAAARIRKGDYLNVSPFFASLEAAQFFEGSDFWAKFTDFYQFRHLGRFRNVRELLWKLENFDNYGTSRKMRKMADKIFARSVFSWAQVLQRFL